MRLENRFHSFFSSQSRNRGREYYHSGCVSGAQGSKTHFSRKVRGSQGEQYQVELRWKATGREIKASCTCPYYESGAFCKHIWAVILAFDEAALEESLPAKPDLALVRGTPSSESFTNDEGEEEEDESPTTGTPWRGSHRKSRKQQWAERLDAIDHACQRRSFLDSPPPEPRAKKNRLV